MTKPAHSELGASSMYRWSACPGSVRECRGVEKKSSSYAEEGTEAHDVAARCLTENLDAWVVANDAEMAEAVQVYVDHCRELMQALPETTIQQLVFVEHRFDLSAVHPGCFGTADLVLWNPAERTLYVRDYKHGAGIPVEAEGNPQLSYYALGALLSLKFPAKWIDMGIVQPRCGHPKGPIRNHVIDALDLLDFRADLIEYAKATEDPNAPLVAGDHCRFCAAAPLCPELRGRAVATAKLEFSPVIPYDPVKLSEALAMRETLKAWIKALDEFAYRELEQGRKIPGWKLVAKRATRKWSSEGQVIERLQPLPGDWFEPRTLKSPAQVEKIMSKGAFEKIVGDLVVKESSGHTLAPDSDDRPEALVGPAADFKVLPS